VDTGKAWLGIVGSIPFRPWRVLGAELEVTLLLQVAEQTTAADRAHVEAAQHSVLAIENRNCHAQ
jgi:hypothetical protein